MRRLLLAFALGCGLIGPWRAQAADAPCPAADYPTFYSDPQPFEAALNATAAIEPWPAPIAAVTVPHHLVAADLIAGGLRLASAQRPDRIVVLMPDHFRRSPTPFAISTRAFATVLGPVPADANAAQALLAPGLVAESCLFGTDHALRALLPFFARLWPGVQVLPVAVALNSTRSDWEAMAARLTAVITPQTLVVQSTDFSHYLPAWRARLHDQQTLNLLAAGDLDSLARLTQPGHVDSVGANWLQVALAARRGFAPLVLANRNQQELTAQSLAETTSYLVVVYTRPGAPAPRAPFKGSHLYLFGGDFFVGRSWPRLLADELAARRTAAAALAATAGLPLIVNLEGVLLPEQPGTLSPLTLAMPAELALDWLRRLNVIAVGLANNHADDIGASGATETRNALTAAGIPFIGQGERLALPGLTVVALSDYRGGSAPQSELLDDGLLDRLILPDATAPVLAFIHWGEEWQPQLNPRQRSLLQRISARGVAVVVGAHPHHASNELITTGGGDTVALPSLGNFLFDQLPPEATGALAEVRTFAQGTLFLRQIPLPPLYQIARTPLQ